MRQLSKIISVYNIFLYFIVVVFVLLKTKNNENESRKLKKNEYWNKNSIEKNEKERIKKLKK